MRSVAVGPCAECPQDRMAEIVVALASYRDERQVRVCYEWSTLSLDPRLQRSTPCGQPRIRPRRHNHSRSIVHCAQHISVIELVLGPDHLGFPQTPLSLRLVEVGAACPRSRSPRKLMNPPYTSARGPLRVRAGIRQGNEPAVPESPQILWRMHRALRSYTRVTGACAVCMAHAVRHGF